MMTPPMSPTEDHFSFSSTIDSRLAQVHATASSTATTSTDTPLFSLSSSPSTQPHLSTATVPGSKLSPTLTHSPRPADMTTMGSSSSFSFGSVSSPTTTSGSFSSSGISPRPLSFHWDDYRGDDYDDDKDDDYSDKEDSSDSQSQSYDDDDRDEEEEGRYGDFDTRSRLSDRGYDHRARHHEDHIINRYGFGNSSYNNNGTYTNNSSSMSMSSASRSRTSSISSRTSNLSQRRGFAGGGSSSGMDGRSHSPRLQQRGFEDEHTFGGSSAYRGGIPDDRYDSLRHGIGTNVSDMSEELAKARNKMNRASRAMRNIEQELETLQLGIDETKATSANARSALEENFWKLECLALSMEKDRQELQKQIQAVGRDCSQAVDTVTNWEVRIDWLGQKLDNTSEYVSELVLSEQECMSFVKMIIQQNRRYAMPAISRSTERNIKLMAPPTLKEISHPSHLPTPPIPQLSMQLLATPPMAPAPAPQPQPQRISSRLGNIPLSWLLEPILPPRPPVIAAARIQELDEHGQEQDSEDEEGNANADATTATAKRRTTIEPPAELWRDFSRLTVALEKGQTRTPFSPFQRARTRNSSSQTQGILSAWTQATNSTSAAGATSSTSPAQGQTVGFKSTAVPRRPQVEGMTAMPKILPASAAASVNRIPDLKRRSKNLAHFPVHSWLQFQFSKTMTNPGGLTLGNRNSTGGGSSSSGNMGGIDKKGASVANGPLPSPTSPTTIKSKPITIFQTIV
ncbi:hypothetical protein EMPS_05580 [Entomortierella parvispora]|uniref:Uncharacterized protein n=1 Tax=Entomortierella parvispora TaxID=205924 RepID=A0A9P3LWM7_9FUNG|nr:hypothetical protein EMPS_05580 [Entomortierella parvispora]